MDEDNTKLGIFSKVNTFSEKLKLKFKENYLDVEVFDELNSGNLSKFNYLIINLIGNEDGLKKVKDIVGNLNFKIIIIFPNCVKNSVKQEIENTLKEIININSNIGIILAPEILGEGVSYNENYISHNIIRQSLISETVKIPKNISSVNVISLNKLIDKVIKETFSFGIAGQLLLINGLKKNISVFITKYVGVDKKKTIYLKEDYPYTQITPTNSTSVEFSLRLAIIGTKKTFSNLAKIEISPKDEEKAIYKANNSKEEILLPLNTLVNTKKTNTKNRNSKLSVDIFKKLSFTIFSIGVIVLIPLILIILSLSSLYLSFKTIEKNNNKLATKLIYTSRILSQTSKNISFGIPFYYNFSNLLIKSSGVGEELLSLGNLTKELVSKIMGDEIYDFEFFSNGISASLDKVYTDVSFLQSDIDEQSGYTGRYISNMLKNRSIDIGSLRKKTYEFKNLTSRFSNLLGLDKPKRYLILFQNNMELRPTGGFIGSFAIITFDKGRLTEIVVNDVYSADGQLKGHVDPPGPILNILGEGGWYMRDSNWDPDFPTTSSKVEWFLDKEMDSQVDGVVAIDLTFIKNILKITGPINLVDFKKVIDENNLYQTTQSEVESEFFPGSIKKASFLTSLSRNLITEVENLPSSKYYLLFKEIYKNLEERHIQIFLHDINSQKAISELGYSGEIDTNTNCGERCITDNYSLVDANLGVNKANYFIERSQEINLEVNKEYINHQLNVNYKNNASNSVGKEGLYKSYTRLLIPQESSVVGIKLIYSNGGSRDLEYEVVDINNRKEIGFLIETLPGVSLGVQISWVLPSGKLKLGGEYDLKIRKQAGTDGDTLKVNIKSKDLSLTGKAVPVYNTSLAKDFSARLFFR